jgi:hypothetical protein
MKATRIEIEERNNRKHLVIYFMEIPHNTQLKPWLLLVTVCSIAPFLFALSFLGFYQVARKPLLLI